MPGIFKVAFNTIDSVCKIDKEGGKPTGKPTFHQWTAGPEQLRNKDQFKPITSGSSDDDETILANDAEDAINLVRRARLDSSCDYQADDEGPDGGGHKAGDWLRSVCVGIQIVRVEPVAFTTL